MAGSTHGLSTSDVEEFFSTRHSVRNFDSNRSVDISVLEDAARLAMFTPSVCNRQASKVYFVTGEEMKEVARKRQNGNTGFGDIPVLAVVTVDTRLFAGPGERNQPWIDGGLFAMSLAWALHGVGLSSCMLNMSVANSVSDALRRDLQIEQHEVVIMQLAIGYPADGYRVARSPRRELGDVVRIVG
jgi:nitroreductase